MVKVCNLLGNVNVDFIGRKRGCTTSVLSNRSQINVRPLLHLIVKALAIGPVVQTGQLHETFGWVFSLLETISKSTMLLLVDIEWLNLSATSRYMLFNHNYRPSNVEISRLNMYAIDIVLWCKRHCSKWYWIQKQIEPSYNQPHDCSLRRMHII